MNIKAKDLSKIGYTNNVARSLAIQIVSKHLKHESKDDVLNLLIRIQESPENYKTDEVWNKLADVFSPTIHEKSFEVFDLLEQAKTYHTFGNKLIDSLAKQQMEMAMRLPITEAGALMPDAHAGYGLPIGGVLATKNAVIPYAVGMDIGCRMSLTIVDANESFLTRYSHAIKQALKEWTHFGMDGGLAVTQDHEILEHSVFREIEILNNLVGKARMQLGTSGSGNHFVEFGKIHLEANNVLNIPEGTYTALLSHSGSRGIGATIAKYYSQQAREVCKLPREAQHFAWLDLDSDLGEQYWNAMHFAGDYATACHELIHQNLLKVLGLKSLGNVNNHHNFAWESQNDAGERIITHRKGATPAGAGVAGFIPGSMASPGYLVVGKGNSDSLFSASHGAGRAMSRQKAKSTFTNSAMKKLLSSQQVQLLGGSVEEIPGAYKDIDKVIAMQSNLVEIQGVFHPSIVRMNKE